MAIILVVDTPAAFVLARAEFPGKRLINTLVDIPAVLPTSAAGIALLLAFGRMGLLGEHLQVLGVQLSFTTAAVVLAELFVATHFYVRQAAVSFAGIDRDVEEAPMVDGAGRTKVFSKITIPLAFPAMVAGAVTAWARALEEFGGTIIFAGSFQGVTQTMPLAIYGTLESDFDAASGALRAGPGLLVRRHSGRPVHHSQGGRACGLGSHAATGMMIPIVYLCEYQTEQMGVLRMCPPASARSPER